MGEGDIVYRMGGICMGGFCPRGGFVLGGFCPGGFCPRTDLDIRIEPPKIFLKKMISQKIFLLKLIGSSDRNIDPLTKI